jgi:hypothetical protein
VDAAQGGLTLNSFAMTSFRVWISTRLRGKCYEFYPSQQERSANHAVETGMRVAMPRRRGTDAPVRFVKKPDAI